LTKTTKVTVGINPGAQSLIINTMKNQGFTKKYNLDMTVRKFLNPPAEQAALIQNQVNIGFGGVTTLAIARAQGRKVFFFGMIGDPSNQIFVKKDSPLKTLADLKGKKLGSFTAKGSATLSILDADAQEVYGLSDFEKQVHIITAPDAALTGLLDKGNIDAVLHGSEATISAKLSGKYRVLADISQDWVKKFDSPPAHLGVATTDSFAKSHCSVMKAFSKALHDALVYVKTTKSMAPWTSYAKEVKLTNPRAPQVLKERIGSTFLSVWNEQRKTAEIDLLNKLIPILGKKDFVSEVPDGLFSTEYWPAS
jgi:NitT/TauT family transport system substrate-binding protein